MIDLQAFEVDAAIGNLFQVPQLAKLNTKDQLEEVTKTFMKDLYLEQPREVQQYFRYELNDRMVTTIFRNYGIDEVFYKDLNPLLTRNLVYYLEYLFQTKGSLETFNIFNDLFSTFYNNIDFYNISVTKIPVNSGNNKLAYMLKPLKLTDDKKQDKFFPSADIDLSGKYLMSLSQYQNYQFFPVDTNMIYIDFADSYGTSNNEDFFMQGIRAYSNTIQQGKRFELILGKLGSFENIYMTDIELIIEYLQISLIRLGDESSQRNYDFSTSSLIFGTTLIFDEGTVPELEGILREYKTVKTNDRKAISSIKRRWQFLLNSNRSNKKLYENFNQLDDYIKEEYPNIYKNIELCTSVDDFMDLYIQLYGTVLNVIDKDDEFIAPYYSALFQNIISGNLFIKNFFQPLFKIFVKYFFPASMDYTPMVGQKVKIKDKFNAIATEELLSTELLLNEFSPHLHFISNRQMKIFIKPESIIISRIDDIRTICQKEILENIEFKEIFKNSITSRLSTDYQIKDSVSTSSLMKTYLDINTRDSYRTKLSNSTFTNYSIREDTVFTTFLQRFTEDKKISSRNRSKQMPVDILIKTSDDNSLNERINITRSKGSFYTLGMTVNDFEYRLARETGMTSAGLTPLENFEVLKKDIYLSNDDTVFGSTYKWFNF